MALLVVLAVQMWLASPAAAGHVSCGDVLTADTTLDSDLVDCPDNGLVIGADGVTLDLAGHTIDGDGFSTEAPACDAGILNGPARIQSCYSGTGYDDVTITGGSVREFDVGVDVELADRNLIRSVTAEDNGVFGIVLSDATDSAIERSRAVRNRGRFDAAMGIVVSGDRHEPDANRVVGNLSVENGADGIFVEGTDLNRVERNVVAGNGDRGIVLHGSDGDVVTRNVVAGNRGIGIEVSDGVHQIRVEQNLVIGNYAAGVWLFEGAHENRVERNFVAGNGIASEGIFDGGIVISGGHDNAVEGNRVWRNDAPGIALDEGSLRTTIANNRVFENTGDGVNVGAGELDVEITFNRATRNGDDGVDVDTAAATLAHNRADRNRDLGIEAAPGVIDGGGNKARHNGNPLQCLNVRCR